MTAPASSHAAASGSAAPRQVRLLMFIAVALAAASGARLLTIATRDHEDAAGIAGIAPVMSMAVANPARSGADPVPEAGAHLAGLIARRQKELDARAEELDTRERLIEAAQRRLALEAAEIRTEIQRLDALLADEQSRRAAEFAALSSAYERMKARDAARIFDDMDDDVLTPIAAGMRTQAIAGVLAEMRPDRARELTRRLANANASAAAPEAVRGPR